MISEENATSHRATSTTTLLLTPSAVRLGALIFIARVISLCLAAAKFWEIGTMYNMLIKITIFTTIAAATTTVVTTTAPAAIRNTTTAARLY